MEECNQGLRLWITERTENEKRRKSHVRSPTETWSVTKMKQQQSDRNECPVEINNPLQRIAFSSLVSLVLTWTCLAESTHA